VIVRISLRHEKVVWADPDYFTTSNIINIPANNIPIGTSNIPTSKPFIQISLFSLE
jgi:hypothetical protein